MTHLLKLMTSIREILIHSHNKDKVILHWYVLEQDDRTREADGRRRIVPEILGSIKIGRHVEKCDLVLKNPKSHEDNLRFISPVHCQIIHTEKDTWLIKDCGSSKGTTLIRGAETYTVGPEPLNLELYDHIILGHPDFKLSILEKK